MKKKIHYAWIILLGICFMRGFSGGGISTSAGLFLKPVTDDINVGIGIFSLYFSIGSIAMLITLPIAGKFIEHYDIRTVVIISALLNAGGFMLLSFMNKVISWYILSIPIAVGATVLNSLLGPILINNWFKERKGTAMGIMMAVVAGTGAILQPIVAWIIATQGWRSAYFLIGGISLVVSVAVALFMLRKHPVELGLKAYGAREFYDSEGEENADFGGMTLKEALRSSRLYLFIAFLVMVSAIASFSQHVPTLGQSFGYSMQYSSFAMSVWLLGSVIGALAIGVLNDKKGIKFAVGCTLVSGVIALGCYGLGQVNFFFYLLGNLLSGFAAVAVTVIPPILTTTLFGNRDYSKIYAIAMMGIAFSAIVFLPIYGFIYDETGSYQGAIWLMATLLAVAVISGFLVLRTKLEEHTE